MLFIHVQNFTSRASNKAWPLHFCLFCKLGLLYINDKFYKFELINNLSCFVITRTHVIHTNETNTLNLYKRYKKEINNLIDGTLLLSFLIPLIMYIESLLLMVIVLIIPFNVFFFWFCKQENEFNADDDLYNDVITAPSSGDNAEVNL